MSKKKKIDSLYRTIKTNFWSDRKVQDEMTAEDRYMFLYLLTNEKTDITGCYEVTFKKIACDTGYDIQQCKKIFERLIDLNIIRYDANTYEVLMLHWPAHNWINGGYRQGVQQRHVKIKSEEFREYIKSEYARIYGADISIPVGEK